MYTMIKTSKSCELLNGINLSTRPDRGFDIYICERHSRYTCQTVCWQGGSSWCGTWSARTRASATCQSHARANPSRHSAPSSPNVSTSWLCPSSVELRATRSTEYVQNWLISLTKTKTNLHGNLCVALQEASCYAAFCSFCFSLSSLFVFVFVVVCFGFVVVCLSVFLFAIQFCTFQKYNGGLTASSENS